MQRHDEMGMRLIPEYEPVSKLYLSFVHRLFNSRFNYGRAICEIVRVACRHARVEILVNHLELPRLRQEFDKHGVPSLCSGFNRKAPGRPILAEFTPLFAQTSAGEPVGLVFENHRLQFPRQLKSFSEELVGALGATVLDLGFGFATAALSVNEDLVLVSSGYLQNGDRTAKLRFFEEAFPKQSFHVVPPLAGDVTKDLDMFLWPIGPKDWIASEYPDGSPQERSIESSLRILRQHGHAVHRVPGLEPIAYGDVNTMPNYANGVILNEAALVPAYNRPEDRIVADLLEEHGYKAFPIDCSDIILTNSGIHCISRTVPKAVHTPRRNRPNRFRS